MFFLNHKGSLRRYLLAAMVSFLTVPDPLLAEQQTDPAADNWFQVEVILFDQKKNSGNESAPQDFQISFPINWLELTNSYPNAGIMRRPIFDQSSTATVTNPNQANLALRLSVLLGTDQYQQNNYNSDTTLIPEASIPYQNNDHAIMVDYDEPQLNALEIFDNLQTDEPSPKETAITEFKPVYETPFQKLKGNLRDLNDTARALNRRKYKVRFHEAWRFQVKSKEQSPWVLIKTDQGQANRHNIEGALRFYKSRYLHFETNLWKLIFSSTNSQEIMLPEIPQLAITSEQAILLKALRFAKKLSSLVPASTTLRQPSASNTDDLLDALKGYNLDSVLPLLDTPRDTAEVANNNQYPVDHIWPIKQSKRIQEDEIYYIDHPYMGALVTIKPYSPEPINQQHNTSFPKSIDKLTNNP